MRRRLYDSRLASINSLKRLLDHSMVRSSLVRRAAWMVVFTVASVILGQVGGAVASSGGYKHLWCCPSNTHVSLGAAHYGSQTMWAIQEFDSTDSLHVYDYTPGVMTCSDLLGHIDYWEERIPTSSFGSAIAYRIDECPQPELVINPESYMTKCWYYSVDTGITNLFRASRVNRCNKTDKKAEFAEVFLNHRTLSEAPSGFTYHTATHEMGHVFGMGHVADTVFEVALGHCDHQTIMRSGLCLGAGFPALTQLGGYDLSWIADQYP